MTSRALLPDGTLIDVFREHITVETTDRNQTLPARRRFKHRATSISMERYGVDCIDLEAVVNVA